MGPGGPAGLPVTLPGRIAAMARSFKFPLSYRAPGVHRPSQRASGDAGIAGRSPSPAARRRAIAGTGGSVNRPLSSPHDRPRRLSALRLSAIVAVLRRPPGLVAVTAQVRGPTPARLRRGLSARQAMIGWAGRVVGRGPRPRAPRFGGDSEASRRRNGTRRAARRSVDCVPVVRSGPAVAPPVGHAWRRAVSSAHLPSPCICRLPDCRREFQNAVRSRRRQVRAHARVRELGRGCCRSVRFGETSLYRLLTHPAALWCAAKPCLPLSWRCKV